MNTKLLKQKILDLAIHGKLVPQNPEDEPASVLLEKIRAEKEEKIQKGERKRDKKDSYIFVDENGKHFEKFGDGSVVEIEKEIPFELPKGWCWCRLRNIGQYKKGPFGSSLTKSMFIPKSDNTIKVYEQKNAINKNHELGTYYISKEYFEEKMKSFEVFPGDIIVSCAGTIGETYTMPDGIEQGIINQALMKMNISDDINITYFLYFFDSILKDESKANGKGTAIKNIPPFDIFKQFLFPLPPLAEQQRIVEQIEKIFAQIDYIEQNQTDLSTLVKQAKSKILDLAIHGKLVEQIPTEESATILLERIRAEKEAKIKAGELKRDKKDSYIFKDNNGKYFEKFADGSIVEVEKEIPFELPEGWCWCRLGEIVINRDTERIPLSREQRKDLDKLFDYYGASGVIDKVNDYIFDKKLLLVGEDGANLLTRNLPIAFLAEGKYWVNNHAHVLDCEEQNIKLEYLMYFINSIDLVEYVTGSAQPKMTQEKMNSILVPLPPRLEQQRIINKIENLFSLLDALSINLD